MAKDCNGKEIVMDSRVEVVKEGCKTKGMIGTVKRVEGDYVFVVYDNDKPPLPACGDHNDYNLKVID